MNIIHIAILALNIGTASLAYNKNDTSSNLAWVAASAMITKVIVDDYRNEKKEQQKEAVPPTDLAKNASIESVDNAPVDFVANITN